jgi:ABC-type transport system substrate-binding protein
VLESQGPLLGQKNIETKRMPTLGYVYIGYNHNTPFFSDKRVRQAMTLSLDRVGMVKNVFYDLGEVVSGPFSKQTPCYDQTIAPMPYDLALAKKKLDEAGWKDLDADGIRDKIIDGKKVPFVFTLTTYGSSDEYATIANIWREALLYIGVRMDPRPLEWSTMLKKMEEREFDAYTGAWAMDWDVDLMQIWHSSEADKAQSSNRIGFKNKEADRIAEALRAELDPTQRVALCHAFHKLAHEEQPYTFFYENIRPVLYWNDLNTPEFAKIWPQFDIRYWSFRGKNE